MNLVSWVSAYIFQIALFFVLTSSLLVPFLCSGPPISSFPSPSMTFAVLRALHGIIGEALDEIEAVYALHGSQNKPSMARDKEPDPAGCSPSTGTTRPSHRPTLSINSLSNVYASPPPSPCIKTENSYESLRQPPLDFPSLDAPYDPSSLSETLTQHPDVVAAINRIVAACGQVTSTVQTPFLTICDAVMGVSLLAFYILPTFC